MIWVVRFANRPVFILSADSAFGRFEHAGKAFIAKDAKKGRKERKEEVRGLASLGPDRRRSNLYILLVHTNTFSADGAAVAARSWRTLS